MKLKKFDYIFICIVALDLIGFFCAPMLRMLVKPLIMASLMLHYIRIMGKDQRLVIMAAMLLALVGDIFLLFDSSDTFFFAGLGCFLLMQLLYAYFFKKYFQPINDSNKKITFAVLILGLLFNIIFFNKLSDKLLPVMLYTAAMTMAYFGINQVLSPQIRLGTILLVLSDFILVINKFISPLGLLPYLVMITYALAQYFIVHGLSEEAEVFASMRNKKKIK
jgi:uncharacterized membrane protein YhhN